MLVQTRRVLASVIAAAGTLVLGRMILLHGPQDVTLILEAPGNTCSSGLLVAVWKGAGPVFRPENSVRLMEVTFPDGHVHQARLSLRLTRGVYRVRAVYDKVTTGSAPPLDQVVDVTKSDTVLLRLNDEAARCP